MQKYGNMKSVQDIENLVKQAGRYIMIYDSSKGDLEIFGSKTKPTSYTRVYEFYPDPKARVSLEKKDMMTLLMYDYILIRFWYHEAKDMGQICFKTSEYNKLSYALKDFRDLLFQLNDGTKKVVMEAI